MSPAGGERQPRHAGQDRLDDAQLEHGAALPGPDVQTRAARSSSVQAPTRAGAGAARATTCCSCSTAPACPRSGRSCASASPATRTPRITRRSPTPAPDHSARQRASASQLRRQRPERRHADLRRHRPAAGPGDRCDAPASITGTPDHGGQLQRGRHRDRRHQHRLGELHLDRNQRRGPHAGPAAAAAAGARRHTASRATPRARAASTCVYKWDFGDGTPIRLVEPVRPPLTRSRPGHLHRDRHGQGRQRAWRVAAASSRPSTCPPPRRAADRVLHAARSRPRASAQRPAVGGEPGQRFASRVFDAVDPRQAGRDRRRHRAALDRAWRRTARSG